jgi:hypothetical protein
MSLTICTGWAPSGWKEYGQRFVETFHRHWPASVQLLVYGEEPVSLPRGRMLPLSSILGAAEFRARHRDSKAANGCDPKPHWRPNWRAAGYNFRWDAWKFSPQGFIPWDAAQVCDTDYLCWLDGDVVTTKDVPEGFIESLLPRGNAVAFLGRRGTHSEIGFQLYEKFSAFPMLEKFKDYYASDRVFTLPEWHSAYVFDQARKDTGVPCHNLTPNGEGHVWFQSPLAEYLDHCKGKRKALGYSPERPR